MGATTNHDLPYPEPTDRARNGSVAIRALAEAVDAKLGPDAAAVFPRVDSPAAVGATAIVAWGAPAVLEGFTYDNAGTLTYTGPSRFFIVHTEVAIDNGGAADVSSLVEVRLNTNAFGGSYDRVQDSGGANMNRSVAHHITTPVYLQTGETIDVTAAASPAGALGMVGLRVYPMGSV